MASEVFQDPLAISILDAKHDTEERWITLGLTTSGQLIVVIHTFREQDTHSSVIRIISARAATIHERRSYEGCD